jgi:phosphatidylglycerol:prolipoprotein diacylglycerol transferase
MINFLGWGDRYPFLKTVGEVIYYGSIIAVIVVFLVLVGKRLLRLGYPKQRVVVFTLLSILMSFPAGYMGSRAAGMFYRPFDEWSFQLLFDSMLHGSSHTFHASLILPLIFGAIFCRFLRLKFLEVFDTIYLYVPLAHAVGRVSCLIVGCCWGSHIGMNLFGLHLSFQNPIPLYAVLANVCIYLFLRRLYGDVYASPRMRARFRGVVLASYFGIYAAVRIIFEVFRSERRIFFQLTQAQIAMGFYILFSAALFATVIFLYRRQRTAAAPARAAIGSARPPDAGAGYRPVAGETAEKRIEQVQHADADSGLGDEHATVRADSGVENLKRLFSAAGLLVFFMLATFLIYYLTRQIYVWKWPFQPAVSLTDAYARILYYMPVLLIPAIALAWLKKCNEPIRPWFAWHRFSWVFVIGLALSVYYAVELLVLRNIQLRGLAFWPPIIILSAMNAFAEEIMYRLALYRMLRRADYSKWVCLVVQSVIYSLIHFMIAGPVLGLFSLVYGFIMGLMTQRSKSLVPAIVCHFIIDLGCIGMPILRM